MYVELLLGQSTSAALTTHTVDDCELTDPLLYYGGHYLMFMYHRTCCKLRRATVKSPRSTPVLCLAHACLRKPLTSNFSSHSRSRPIPSLAQVTSIPT